MVLTVQLFINKPKSAKNQLNNITFLASKIIIGEGQLTVKGSSNRMLPPGTNFRLG